MNMPLPWQWLPARLQETYCYAIVMLSLDFDQTTESTFRLSYALAAELVD